MNFLNRVIARAWAYLDSSRNSVTQDWSRLQSRQEGFSYKSIKSILDYNLDQGALPEKRHQLSIVHRSKRMRGAGAFVDKAKRGKDNANPSADRNDK